MKRTKRGMALILAAVMAVSCLTTILLAASKPWTECCKFTNCTTI